MRYFCMLSRLIVVWTFNIYYLDWSMSHFYMVGAFICSYLSSLNVLTISTGGRIPVDLIQFPRIRVKCLHPLLKG